jgi:isopentenyl diphosphate isomerase/L-lactate dehydrogenase-like FMN-dependent dehydrogenase
VKQAGSEGSFGPHLLADSEAQARAIARPVEWAFRHRSCRNVSCRTYKNDRAAFEHVLLRPRVLAGVGPPDLSATTNELAVHVPFVAGPSASHPAGQLPSVRPVGSVDLPFVPSLSSRCRPEEVGEAAEARCNAGVPSHHLNPSWVAVVDPTAARQPGPQLHPNAVLGS